MVKHQDHGQHMQDVIAGIVEVIVNNGMSTFAELLFQGAIYVQIMDTMLISVMCLLMNRKRNQ